MRNNVRRGALLLSGAVLQGMGIVCFVRTAGLFPGGFTGVSLLLQELCGQ